MNWDDPSARAALAMRLGPDGYNKAFEAHLKESTVATVGGHAIRPIGTRFGRLFSVGSTGTAFSTQAQAEEYARTNPLYTASTDH